MCLNKILSVGLWASVVYHILHHSSHQDKRLTLWDKLTFVSLYKRQGTRVLESGQSHLEKSIENICLMLGQHLTVQSIRRFNTVTYNNKKLGKTLIPSVTIWLTIMQIFNSVVSDSLWLHGLQHARLPCPSPTPRAYSNSCPLSR